MSESSGDSSRYQIQGDQRPRLFHLPPTQVASAGLAAVDLARLAGLELDPWQQWVLQHALGEKDEWYYNSVLGKQMRKSSAYEIALIVARQNGKGTVMEALELAWLFLLGAKVICHSAHEFATSKEHFQRIESLISGTPELKGELARGGIKWSHGDESITLANGQRLIFKTRTKGAARGFSIDKLVMDEAMILKNEQVAAMQFATSARPDVQIMYAGSAGDRDSEHFGRARDRGIAGSDQRLFFAEWSADLCDEMCYRDCTEHTDRPDNPRTWARANPGLGYRLQIDNIQSEFNGMDSDVFNTERLSVGDWPVLGEAWRVISQAAWMNRYDEMSRIQGAPVFSIDTTPDLRYSCIAAAGSNGEGSCHVEVTGQNGVMDHRPGTKWVVPRAVELSKRHRGSVFVIDKGTQAGAYIDELTNAGVKVLTPTTREFAQGCGDFYSGIVPRGGGPDPDIVHIDQPELKSAVAGADKRELADLWAWDKRNSSVDISPLVAVTNAVWGYRKQVNKPKPKPLAAWGG
ncbi:terminase [Streptomyces sp. I8-5]|uniref:terminase n=1 Tax=Streptomyces sp. I8-5 TaxID=3104277 RepID=UPI00386E6122